MPAGDTPSNPIIVRASSVDSLFDCPPSVLKREAVRSKSLPGQEAAIGKAVHECIAAYIDNRLPDMPAALRRHGVDDGGHDAAFEHLRTAERMWDQLAEYFPAPLTEAVVQSEPFDVKGVWYRIDGTCDVLSPVGSSSGIFIDWKTGRLSGYRNSNAAYAWLLWQKLGKPADAQITAIIARTAYGFYRTTHWTADQLSDWEFDLTHNVLGAPEVYHPGEQCKYCPIYAGCDARRNSAEAAVDVIMLGGSTAQHAEYARYVREGRSKLASVTPETRNDPELASLVRDLRHRLEMGKLAIRDLEDTLKEALINAGGEIPLGDSRRLVLQDRERRTLEPVSAWPVLRKHMSDAEIAGASNISLTKIQEIAAKRIARGRKAEAKAKITNELADAGAILVTPFKVMAEVDMPHDGQTDQDAKEPKE